jgi:hypothetical protein
MILISDLKGFSSYFFLDKKGANVQCTFEPKSALANGLRTSSLKSPLGFCRAL